MGRWEGGGKIGITYSRYNFLFEKSKTNNWKTNIN